MHARILVRIDPIDPIMLILEPPGAEGGERCGIRRALKRTRIYTLVGGLMELCVCVCDRGCPTDNYEINLGVRLRKGWTWTGADLICAGKNVNCVYMWRVYWMGLKNRGRKSDVTRGDLDKGPKMFQRSYRADVYRKTRVNARAIPTWQMDIY